MSADRPAGRLSPADLAPQDVVLRFLESTGRPSEARLYLDLFRARPREQFAALAIDANVMAGAPDAVVQDLRFLAALDLYPTVVLGIFQPADAAGARTRPDPAPRRRRPRRREPVRGGPALSARVTAAAAAAASPSSSSSRPRRTAGRPARAARRLLRELQTPKLLFLHRPGGLRQAAPSSRS